MDDIKTNDLDALLRTKSLRDYDALIKNELSSGTPSLSSYLEDYIAKHNLGKSKIIHDSQLSRDYAYGIINGNKDHPTRDRVIALCMAMHMTREETDRALKLCNAGVLYPKNQRDALICIAINSEEYNIIKLNEMLHENGQDILQTSKDV